MRAYHRIIGDPPSRGFGSDISSVGFPGGSWAAKVIDRRLPPLGGIPFFDDQLIPMGKAMEVQRAYELQSLDFQRVAVAFSAEGMPAGSAGATSGRPHGYTHIVALALILPLPEIPPNLSAVFSTIASKLSKPPGSYVRVSYTDVKPQ